MIKTVASLFIGVITCLVLAWLQFIKRNKRLPEKYVEKLFSVTNENNALNFGYQTGVVRRHLIKSTTLPCAYSSVIDEPLTISKHDIGNKKVLREAIQYQKARNKLYGFFHPYCNAGGGGEKVLWKAVEVTLLHDDKNIAIIYTGDTDAKPQDILNSVKDRFDYNLDDNRIVFIYLKYRHLVDDKTWPHLTLLGQALGSIVLSLEAFFKLTPDIWCDTMGYPFAYPFVKVLGQIPVVTYTHFPIISTDMLDKLKNSNKQMNLKITLKYAYWKVFMFLYTFIGFFVSVAITNSTWTNNHIKNIWTMLSPVIIYPPCSTEKLVIKESTWERRNEALVLAQFRPEKRHNLIIEAFAKSLESEDNNDNKNPLKLIMIGSTRSQEDRDYIQTLEKMAYGPFKIPKDRLEFVPDCPYDDVKNYLHECAYGINAMWNEHFGIAVVEYVAAGLIPLVHASAGPLLDIVVPWNMKNETQAVESTDQTRTGFFFKSKTDPDYSPSNFKKYLSLSEIFTTISQLSDVEKHEITQRGKSCVTTKFSDAEFDKQWTREVLNSLNNSH